MSAGAPYVGVIGAAEATAPERERAEAVGAGLARAGAIVVCGGLGGVMEAACRGAALAGGLTVGILPGHDRRAANGHVQLALATGLGELRNGLIVRCCDSLIAIGGGWGTLSEIALAMRTGQPLVALGSWEQSLAAAPEGCGREGATASAARLLRAGDAERAVSLALELAAASED